MAASSKRAGASTKDRPYGQAAESLAGYWAISVAMDREGGARVSLLRLDMTTRRLVFEALSPRRFAGPGLESALQAIHDASLEASVDRWSQLPLWC